MLLFCLALPGAQAFSLLPLPCGLHTNAGALQYSHGRAAASVKSFERVRTVCCQPTTCLLVQRPMRPIALVSLLLTLVCKGVWCLPRAAGSLLISSRRALPRAFDSEGQDDRRVMDGWWPTAATARDSMGTSFSTSLLTVPQYTRGCSGSGVGPGVLASPGELGKRQELGGGPLALSNAEPLRPKRGLRASD